MFAIEKEWIIEQLSKIDTIGPKVIDVGCATSDYRAKQPYINDLYEYLKSRCDIFKTLDIDSESRAIYVVDLAKRDQIDDIGRYDLVLCTNVLEHVRSIDKVVENLELLISPGGILVLTAPVNLPLHHGYDNGFRPSPEELVALFPSFKKIDAETWQDSHYREPFISQEGELPIVSGAVLRNAQSN